MLSCAVNVVMLPVYHAAEGWQEEERAAQSRMAARLAEIKSVYSGSERDMIVRGLYRLHGYHPVMGLRTCAGLLIQVPFFIAAFHLLNNLALLSGVSFMGIPNISRPDGLLSLGDARGNVLPFIMTAVNLLSASVYTKRLGLGEKRQLVLIAALFMVLLYTSSAALLLYWTCNNLFSLLKNSVYVRWVYDDAPRHASFQSLARFPARFAILLDRIPAWYTPALTSLGTMLYIGGAIFQYLPGHSLPPALSWLAFACLASASFMWMTFLRRHEEPSIRGVWGTAAFLGLTVLLLVWGLSGIRDLDSPDQWTSMRLFACNTGLLLICFLAQKPLRQRVAQLAAVHDRALPKDAAARLYVAAFITMAVLVFAYSPSLVYQSDPQFFFEPIPDLFAGLAWYAAIFLAVGCLLFRAAPQEGRSTMAFLAAWCALIVCVYTLLVPANYGQMEEFLLADTEKLTGAWRWIFPLDAPVCVLCALALWFAARNKFLSKLPGILVVLALSLGSMTLWSLITVPQGEASSGNGSGALPRYTDALFSFSRNNDNILVLMLDEFTGSHLGRIMREDPDLAAQFPGFIWYKDTLAPGASTQLSIASMLGGANYTPAAINGRPISSPLDEMNKAFAILPNIFLAQGRAVALADVESLTPRRFAELVPGAHDVTIASGTIGRAYSTPWQQKHGLEIRRPSTLAPFLAAMGFFRGAPWSMRSKAYDKGEWMGSLRLKPDRSSGHIALLDLLPDLSRAVEQPPTFKYMASQVSHHPWQVDPNTCMPTDNNGYTWFDGIILEHYYAERYAVRAVARWLDWMRKEGVYDNTQIIIASDHSHDDSDEVNTAFEQRYGHSAPGRPHALLMVKGKDASAPLATDMRPMSGADIPMLICREAGPCPGLSDPDPLMFDPMTRKREHSVKQKGHAHRSRFHVTTYEVTGSMFEAENWRKLE